MEYAARFHQHLQDVLGRESRRKAHPCRKARTASSRRSATSRASAPKDFKIVGGAAGLGLRTIVQDAYNWVVDNYRDDQELYIYGFSRGAYAARALAGLIGDCGIRKTQRQKHLRHRAGQQEREKGLRVGRAAERSRHSGEQSHQAARRVRHGRLLWRAGGVQRTRAAWRATSRWWSSAGSRTRSSARMSITRCTRSASTSAAVRLRRPSGR